MSRSWLAVLSLIVGAVVIVVWLLFFPPRWWLNATKTVDLTDPVGAGKTLVEKYNCRQCHFIGEEGKSKGPELPGVTKRLDAVSLRLWLRDPGSVKGSTSMPDFQLSDSEIEGIVSYLAALDNNTP
ncbi:MAG: c-type cytochrome [Proteobacteria bacterium]|nr:c-type cytochrome [Pseudomonadota bacterium]MDA1022392.1 c-type cytochrome [Pseudomonadota bacterium]